MVSLANKYRPQDFKNVSSQQSVIRILERQLETGKLSNVYSFSGPTGVGKTTLARIFANKINKGQGSPIEIDGASNNGVDNVRNILQLAKERSIDAEYKIFIIDEAHALTGQAWQAFLKGLEEPPKYTIYMFCTTEPQKMPPTIQNRLMRFNLTKIPTHDIKKRLEFISAQEGLSNYVDACDYIAKLSDGGMRDAIAMLDKCANYSSDLSMSNVLNCLGNFSHKTMFELTNAIIDGNLKTIIEVVEGIHNDGNDLKLFIDTYLDFILDIHKYTLFQDIDTTKIPNSLENDVKYVTSISDGEVQDPNYSKKFYGYLTDKILEIKLTLRYDTSIKNTVSAMLLKIGRGG